MNAFANYHKLARGKGKCETLMGTDAVNNFITLAEAYAVALQFEKQYEPQGPDDLDYRSAQFASQNIGRTLKEVGALAIEAVKNLGIDATPIARCIASVLYHDRFNDEWISCHAFLMANESKPVSRDCPISMAALYQLCVGKVNRVGQEVAGSESTVRGWKNAKGFPEAMTWNSVRHWLNRTKDYDIGSPPTEC